MNRHRILKVPAAVCALLAAVIGCTPAVSRDVPPFVAQLIARMEAAPVANPPGSVWKFNYKGRVVFYVPPSCCDVASELYDGDGNLICGPDGGLTGDGDGKCPDFFEQRTDELQVWSDPRG